MKTILLFWTLFAMHLVCGCADDDAGEETWVSQMHVHQVIPGTLLPNTVLEVQGEGFVSQILGTSRLKLTGTFTGPDGNSAEVDLALLLNVMSSEKLQVLLSPASYSRICPVAPGELNGVAELQVASVATRQIHRTTPVAVNLLCRSTLSPRLVDIADGSYHLNDPVTVRANNLLKGNGEGQTYLLASGCFLLDSSAPPCDTNGVIFKNVYVPLTVLDSAERRDGSMTITPDLVGVYPGTLVTKLKLVNIHADGAETFSAGTNLKLTILPSRLESVEMAGASLGGYVDFLGAGFVGNGADEDMEFDLQGSFVPDNGAPSRDLDLTLMADFDTGRRARYVLNEQDSLGELVDLCNESGTVIGRFTPRIVKGSDAYTGEAVTGSFRIEPVSQVVYVNFTQGYRDALELFGLRALDERIRARILAKARGIYRGVGVTFVSAVPQDYVWYAQVDLTGIDPNGLGFMGYDNSPGKDVGNERLYDRIGGVNALTQEDGYPGYGGVFVESFLAFSEHPPPSVISIPHPSSRFDEIFDHFRPDTGDPVQEDELAGFSALESVDFCTTEADRDDRILCAIFVLGNLLGGTMAHELGHSLGLSDPEGDQFHNSGDGPYRLMDSGFDRPFDERAELSGGGSEVFCRQNYDYLRSILSAGRANPITDRPDCF